MSEEYCDGVKILLKRMESNPEEFTKATKWSEFLPLNDYWTHALTAQETYALKEGLRKISSKLFTERVIAKLLEDKESTSPIASFHPAGLVYTPSAWPDPRLLQNAHTPLRVQEAVKKVKPKSFWSQFFNGMIGR
jgi:hypothetical protein